MSCNLREAVVHACNDKQNRELAICIGVALVGALLIVAVVIGMSIVVYEFFDLPPWAEVSIVVGSVLALLFGALAAALVKKSCDELNSK